MTKQEANRAREHWSERPAGHHVETVYSDLELALNDREKLVDALKPFAEAWDRGMDKIPNFERLCESANILLREIGELE